MVQWPTGKQLPEILSQMIPFAIDITEKISLKNIGILIMFYSFIKFIIILYDKNMSQSNATQVSGFSSTL